MYDGTKADIYVDGEKKGTIAGSQGSDANAKVFLGAMDANGTDGFQGTLDEVWFSHTVRSKDYMRLLYESQKRFSPFLTVLPQY